MTAQWRRSTLTEEDASGLPIVGAKAYFYDTGTTTPRTVYSDAALTVAIAQPVLTNGVGRWPQVFVQPGIYDYRVDNPDDSLIFTELSVDPGIDTSASGTLPIAKGGTGAATATAARSALGAASQLDVDGLNVSLAALDTRVDVTEADITVIEGEITALEALIAGQAQPSGDKRQCIQSCVADSSGIAQIIPATSASLTITLTNISVANPLVVSAALGFDTTGAAERFGSTTTALVFSGLTPSSTNFLFVTVNPDKTLTPGFTTLQPIYQRGGTPSNASGQYTFQIEQMRGYVGTGGSFTAANRVFIGEAVTDGSSVTSTVNYAVRCYADVVDSANLPGASTLRTINHNLGFDEQNLFVTFRNVIAEGGYSPGYETPNLMTLDASTRSLVVAATANNRNSARLQTSSGALLYLTSTGASAAPTVANWRIRLRAWRPW